MRQHYGFKEYCLILLTVSAWLDRSFNIPNALDSDTVLVIAVDELIFELANLVDEHTELVGDIGDIIFAGLAPDGELLLREWSASLHMQSERWENILQLPSSPVPQAPSSASHSSPSSRAATASWPNQARTRQGGRICEKCGLNIDAMSLILNHAIQLECCLTDIGFAKETAALRRR